MSLHIRLHSTALLALAALATACGGEWNPYEPNLAALPDDKAQALTYPAGPYGTKTGDTIDNIKFSQAFFDPMTACKGAKDLNIKDTGWVRTISLGDIYRGNTFCSTKKKQFLWVIASAGW